MGIMSVRCNAYEAVRCVVAVSHNLVVGVGDGGEVAGRVIAV